MDAEQPAPSGADRPLPRSRGRPAYGQPGSKPAERLGRRERRLRDPANSRAARRLSAKKSLSGWTNTEFRWWPVPARATRGASRPLTVPKWIPVRRRS
jgi:hypothetical protein